MLNQLLEYHEKPPEDDFVNDVMRIPETDDFTNFGSDRLEDAYWNPMAIQLANDRDGLYFADVIGTVLAGAFILRLWHGLRYARGRPVLQFAHG